MTAPLKLNIPSTKALVAFERAATLGSFAAAAVDLHLTPSAISHAVLDIEKRLGVKLFTRVGRSIQLNSHGEKYYHAVCDALNTLDKASRDLSQKDEGRVINVSASPFFSSVVLIPLMADFENELPGYDLRINTSNGYSDFDSDDVDIAIRVGGGAPNLHIQKLIDVRAIPLCNPSLKKSKKNPLNKIDDLANHTLIHISHMPNAWRNWLVDVGKVNVEGKRNIELDTTVGVLDAVKNGLGVGLGIYPLIYDYSGFGDQLITPFDTPGNETMRFNVVSRIDDATNKKATLFTTWLLDKMHRYDAYL